MARLSLILATLFTVLILAAPAPAHRGHFRKQIEARQHDHDVWRAKLYYWRAKRRQAIDWGLSYQRRHHAWKMIRSRKWHAAKAAQGKQWWRLQQRVHYRRTHVQPRIVVARAAVESGDGLSSPPNIVRLGRQLQGEGYAVGEHPAFGGYCMCHATNSRHYVARAVDINADGRPGGEMVWLDRLAARLRAAGWNVLWRVAGHYDHLHADY